MSYVGFCPPGVVLPYAGAVAPEGWLLCDGTAISRTTYGSLFSAISTTYGTGDGSTTFTLPDFRGVYPRGAGTNSTTNYGGVTGHTPAGGSLGSKGGQKTAKNGLGNAASGISVSLNGMNQNAAHGHSIGNVRRAGLLYANGPYGPAWEDAGTGTLTSAASVNTDHVHTLSSGSATAQIISGDTETTPSFLAVNYIIKI